MKKNFEEFKATVNGIQYDMENDQLYVANGDVAATIDNPYDAASTYEDGVALEEKAEADPEVWEALYEAYMGVVYVIQNRESGHFITWVETEEAADHEIALYEAEDKKDGIYEEDFYEYGAVPFADLTDYQRGAAWRFEEV